MLVGELTQPQRLAADRFRPESLRVLATLVIVLDNSGGGREDRLSRAVVLLELHHLGFGEVPLEVQDIPDVGVPEAVDRLVLVSYDHQVVVLGGEQLQQPVLSVVGVLVLVDQNVAEGAAPALTHLLEQLQRVDGPHQQVVEVHRVRLEHPLLIERESLGDDLLKWTRRRFRIHPGVDQLVLGAGDLRADRARRVALRVDVQLVHAAFEHPQRVGLVVDREAARVAEPLSVGAQHPGAGRVEGRHPHRPGRAADQRLDPLAHLLGGFVGEGDREDLARPGGAGRQQVGDPVGEHAGLAGAGAGQHQQRPLAVAHRLALRLVQLRQQPLGAVGAGLGRGCFGLEHLLRE